MIFLDYTHDLCNGEGCKKCAHTAPTEAEKVMIRAAMHGTWSCEEVEENS